MEEYMSLIKQYLLARLRELEEDENTMQPLSKGAYEALLKEWKEPASKEAYEALLKEWNDSLSKPLS